MMYILYNLLIILFFPVILFGLLLKYRFRFIKYFLTGIAERLGKISFPEYLSARPVLWLHASSVGELNMLKPLIAELRTHYLSHRIYLSTVTPEALEMARKEKLAEFVFFAPVDIAPVVRRVVRRVRPVLLLLAESEFWPNLVVESKKTGTVVGVVNTRVSDNAFRWMQFFSRWYRYILSHIDFFGARTQEDKERIIALGVEKDRVELTGNIKYDGIQVQPLLPDTIDRLYKNFHMSQKNIIFVCGSIHPAETVPIIRAYLEVKSKFPLLSIILAPRHIDKVPGIVKSIKRFQIPFRLQSQSSVTDGDYLTPCLVLDTIGDLISAYRIATVVFIGGSLVNKGGQNIIEPALLEKPVIFGPHMDNFKSSTRELLCCGGAVQVKNSQELSPVLMQLVSDRTMRAGIARRAFSVASGLKGGALHTVHLIHRWMK